MRLKYLMLAIFPIVLVECSGYEKTQPQRRNIVDAVFASGSIVTDNQYMVTSQSEGYLVNSFVEEGDTVKAGSMLFHVQDQTQRAQLASAEAAYSYAKANMSSNSAVLQQLNAQLAQVKNKLAVDSVNFVRYQSLVHSRAVSVVEYEKSELAYENSKQELYSLENLIADTQKNLDLELVKARANLVSQQNTSSFCELQSKVNGVVLQVLKQNGELVKRGETIAEIGSGDYIAKLLVAEEDINRIALGQEVLVELNTEKHKAYRASVSKIYPAFNTSEQSFTVDARFLESIRAVKVGTQLQANIVVEQKKNALVIPSGYLLPGNYVVTHKGMGKKRVEVGIVTPEWTEVLQGLTDNTFIVLPR